MCKIVDNKVWKNSEEQIRKYDKMRNWEDFLIILIVNHYPW